MAVAAQGHRLSSLSLLALVVFLSCLAPGRAQACTECIRSPAANETFYLDDPNGIVWHTTNATDRSVIVRLAKADANSASGYSDVLYNGEPILRETVTQTLGLNQLVHTFTVDPGTNFVILVTDAVTNEILLVSDPFEIEIDPGNVISIPLPPEGAVMQLDQEFRLVVKNLENSAYQNDTLIFAIICIFENGTKASLSKWGVIRSSIDASDAKVEDADRSVAYTRLPITSFRFAVLLDGTVVSDGHDWYFPMFFADPLSLPTVLEPGSVFNITIRSLHLMGNDVLLRLESQSNPNIRETTVLANPGASRTYQWTVPHLPAGNDEYELYMIVAAFPAKGFTIENDLTLADTHTLTSSNVPWQRCQLAVASWTALRLGPFTASLRWVYDHAAQASEHVLTLVSGTPDYALATMLPAQLALGDHYLLRIAQAENSGVFTDVLEALSVLDDACRNTSCGGRGNYTNGRCICPASHYGPDCETEAFPTLVGFLHQPHQALREGDASKVMILNNMTLEACINACARTDECIAATYAQGWTDAALQCRLVVNMSLASLASIERSSVVYDMFTKHPCNVDNCSLCTSDGDTCLRCSSPMRLWDNQCLVDCPPGTHLDIDSLTHGETCTPCPPGTFAPVANAAACVDAATCAPVGMQYEAREPTPSSDRICLNVTVCAAHERPIIFATEDTDNVCANAAVPVEFYHPTLGFKLGTSSFDHRSGRSTQNLTLPLQSPLGATGSLTAHLGRTMTTLDVGSRPPLANVATTAHLLANPARLSADRPVQAFLQGVWNDTGAWVRDGHVLSASLSPIDFVAADLQATCTSDIRGGCQVTFAVPAPWFADAGGLVRSAALRNADGTLAAHISLYPSVNASAQPEATAAGIVAIGQMRRARPGTTYDVTFRVVVPHNRKLGGLTLSIVSPDTLVVDLRAATVTKLFSDLTLQSAAGNGTRLVLAGVFATAPEERVIELVRIAFPVASQAEAGPLVLNMTLVSLVDDAANELVADTPIAVLDAADSLAGLSSTVRSDGRLRILLDSEEPVAVFVAGTDQPHHLNWAQLEAGATPPQGNLQSRTLSSWGAETAPARHCTSNEDSLTLAPGCDTWIATANTSGVVTINVSAGSLTAQVRLDVVGPTLPLTLMALHPATAFARSSVELRAINGTDLFQVADLVLSTRWRGFATNVQLPIGSTGRQLVCIGDDVGLRLVNDTISVSAPGICRLAIHVDGQAISTEIVLTVNDTNPVQPRGVIAHVVTGLESEDPAVWSSYTDVSTAAVWPNANFSKEGQQGRLAVYGALSDGSILPLSLGTGPNTVVPSLRQAAAGVVQLALDTYRVDSNAPNASLDSAWLGASNTTVARGEVRFQIALPAPVSLELFVSDVQITRNGSVAARLGVATQITVTVIVHYDDGTQRAVPSTDDRLSLAVDAGQAMVSGAELRLVASAAPGPFMLRANFSHGNLATNQTLTAVEAVALAGRLRRFPVPTDVNVTSLARIGATAIWQQARVEVDAVLSDGSRIGVSHRDDVAVVSATPDRVQVSWLSNLYVVTRSPGGAFGAAQIYMSLDTLNATLSLTVLDSAVAVASITGLSFPTTFTGSVGTQALPSCSVTLEDGSELPASFLFDETTGHLLLPGLFEFGVSNTASVTVNASSGLATLLDNDIVSNAYGVQAVRVDAEPGVREAVSFAANLAAAPGLADIGAQSGIPLPTLSVGDVVDVPLLLHFGAVAVEGAAASLSIFYNATAWTVLDVVAAPAFAGIVAANGRSTGVVNATAILQGSTGVSGLQPVLLLTLRAEVAGDAALSVRVLSFTNQDQAPIGDAVLPALAPAAAVQARVTPAVLRRRRALTCSQTEATATCPASRPAGDADGNCCLTPLDVLYQLDYIVLAELGTPLAVEAFQLAGLDADLDGVVALSDALLTLRAQAGLLAFASEPSVAVPAFDGSGSCMLQVNVTLSAAQDTFLAVGETFVVFILQAQQDQELADGLSASWVHRGTLLEPQAGSSTTAQFIRGELLETQGMTRAVFGVELDSRLSLAQLGISYFQGSNATLERQAANLGPWARDSSSAELYAAQSVQLMLPTGVIERVVSPYAPPIVVNHTSSSATCRAARRCGAGEYTAVNATLTSDPVCQPGRTCAAFEFETSPLREYENRICANASVCDATSQFIAAPLTATTDRTCATATPCKAHEYQTMPKQAETDFSCANVTECRVGEYTSASPTATSNRVCQAIVTCGPDEYEVTAPTNTSNRVCEQVPMSTPPARTVPSSNNRTSATGLIIMGAVLGGLLLLFLLALLILWCWRRRRAKKPSKPAETGDLQLSPLEIEQIELDKQGFSSRGSFYRRMSELPEAERRAQLTRLEGGTNHRHSLRLEDDLDSFKPLTLQETDTNRLAMTNVTYEDVEGEAEQANPAYGAALGEQVNPAYGTALASGLANQNPAYAQSGTPDGNHAYDTVPGARLDAQYSEIEGASEQVNPAYGRTPDQGAAHYEVIPRTRPTLQRQSASNASEPAYMDSHSLSYDEITFCSGNTKRRTRVIAAGMYEDIESGNILVTATKETRRAFAADATNVSHYDLVPAARSGPGYDEVPGQRAQYFDPKTLSSGSQGPAYFDPAKLRSPAPESEQPTSGQTEYLDVQPNKTSDKSFAIDFRAGYDVPTFEPGDNGAGAGLPNASPRRPEYDEPSFATEGLYSDAQTLGRDSEYEMVQPQEYMEVPRTAILRNPLYAGLLCDHDKQVSRQNSEPSRPPSRSRPPLSRGDSGLTRQPVTRQSSTASQTSLL